MKKVIFPFKSRLLKTFLLSFSLFLILSIFFVTFKNYRTHKPKASITANIRTSNWSDSEVLSTAILPLGQAGAYTFKNLFFLDNNYLVANSEGNSSPTQNLLNQPSNYLYEIKDCDEDFILQNREQLKTKKFTGTTLVFSASDTFSRMQDHYFHFCEEFILALTVLKQSQDSNIDTIIFPNKDHWEGRFNQINAKIIKALFPNAQVINASQFAHLSKKHLLKFDNAIFIDRAACHQIEDTQKYNKMLIGHHKFIKKEYLQELRDALHKSLRTYEHPTRKPYITYIQRSSYRYLEPSFEKKLLDDLAAQFPNYTLLPVKFENYTYPEQLQIIRNTKVLIGAHDCGLTHELFLPDDSLVFEIFPKGAFTMDYEYYAELCGHKYYALAPEEGIIAKVGDRMPFRGDVNQVIPEFDTSWITNLIRDYTSFEQTSDLNEMSLSE